MPRQVLDPIVQELIDRLHLGPGERLDLVADDAQLFHLEQRLAGRSTRPLTPPLAPAQLVLLLEGMGLALDLDRRQSPSRSVFRTMEDVGSPPAPAPGPPQEPR
jgi:hypothetical protein